MSSLHIKVFTIFPDLFPGPLAESLTGRALKEDLWQLDAVNLRDFASDKHKSVDDTPFGGGAGMVMRPDVLDRAFEACYQNERPGAFLYMSPKGAPLTQARVKELAKQPSIGLLCGRFEGVDQRVLDAWAIEEVSIGDFVMTGGEIPAMCLVDSVVRLLPGVVGSPESLEEESFSHGLLEYPQYTRPRLWKGVSVPEVLLEGHHEKIKTWRREMAEKITRERRPDLWHKYSHAKTEE